MIDAKISTAFLPYPEKGDRKIWVYVPKHKEDDKLPVVYMTDGQNLFDEFPTLFGSWGVTGAVEAEIALESKGAIIVGIDNGNVYRDNELTPSSIGEIICGEEMENFTEPEGEIFDSFLIDTVMPFVESNFPVKTGRKHTSICGSSSGGLQAFFSGIEHKNKFAFIGAFSPAFLLYSEESWRKYLLSKITDDMPYLYIYTGAQDLDALIYPSVEMVYDLLFETGYPLNRLNEVVLFEKGHNEAAWREIFPDFLHTALFGNGINI